MSEFSSVSSRETGIAAASPGTPISNDWSNGGLLDSSPMTASPTQTSTRTMSGIDARIAQREAMKARARALEMRTHPSHQSGGGLPNTPMAVATIAFILGGIFSIALLTFLVGGFERYWWLTYQLGFFMATWSGFHYGEFAVTAGWNREKLSVDSFLLDNGIMYHVAHTVALFEYLVTLYFFRASKSWSYVSAVGIVVTVAGQLLRSMAMIHASTNFSHSIAYYKVEGHRLVTNGVYSFSRHPSYTGFFYWGIGTQLVLQNPIAFTLYLVLLWRFFSIRIKSEEGALVRFFGQEYIHYKTRVGTKIPFIP